VNSELKNLELKAEATCCESRALLGRRASPNHQRANARKTKNKAAMFMKTQGNFWKLEEIYWLGQTPLAEIQTRLGTCRMLIVRKFGLDSPARDCPLPARESSA
jgi:hypothetical protein